VATLLLLSAKITVAQSVDLSTLEHCAGLATQDLKLACFEAIIAGRKTLETRRPEAVDSPLPEQPAAEIEAVPEVEPPVEQMRQEAPAASEAATAQPVTVSQLGEEHLAHPETKANDDEIFHATVIEVSKGRNRTLYFHFDNGQVWRQMEARHLEYPRSGEFDINIRRGMMGDYRMRIGDNGRMVRIRRVE
jgi:hypothetical protein